MPFKKIAVGTDFSPNAEAAFKTALEMASLHRARLFVLHVMPPVVKPILTDSEWITLEEPREELLSDLNRRMQQTYGNRIEAAVEHELVVLDGHVSSEILNFLETREIDLAVLGSFGLTGMGLVLFGSVAKRVVHKAPCSVMIVRSQA